MAELSKYFPVNYIQDDMIFLKDGAVAKGLEIEPLDNDTTPRSVREAVASSFSTLLTQLPPGVTIQHVLAYEVATPNVEQNIKDEVSDTLKALTMRRLEYYSTPYLRLRHFIFVICSKEAYGNVLQIKKFITIFDKQDVKSVYEKLKDLVSRVCGQVEFFLKQNGIKVNKLDSYMLYRLVYYYMNLMTAPLNQNNNNRKVYKIDDLLAHDVGLPPHTPYSVCIGSKHAVVFTMSVLPEATTPYLNTKPPASPLTTITMLLGGGFPLFISYVVKTIDQQKIRGTFETKTMIQKRLAGISRDAQVVAEEGEEFLTRMARGEHVVEVGINVMTYFNEGEFTPREIEDRKASIMQTFSSCVFNAQLVEEKWDGYWMYVAQIPGCGHLMPKTFKMMSVNAGHLFSPYGYWHNEEKGDTTILLRSRQYEPVSFDFFTRKLPSWNALVVGPTGTGKSFTMNFLMAQFLANANKIFILDIGGSYKKMSTLLGAPYFEISFEEPIYFPVFPKEVRNITMDVLRIRPVLLRMMMENYEQHVKEGKILSKIVDETIEELYKDGSSPTLYDFRKKLASKNNKFVDLKHLAQKIDIYIEGQYKCFFMPDGNGKKEDKRLKDLIQYPLVAFDLARLEDFPELQTILSFMITNLIWRTIEGDKVHKKNIIADECWKFFLAFPEMGQAIMELFRTVRKMGGQVTAITQRIDDIQGELGQAILQNALIQILLRHDKGVDVVKEVLSLTDEEAEVLSTLSRGEALLRLGDEAHVVRIDASPWDYWLFTTHRDDNRMLEEKLKEKHGDLISAIEELVASL